MPADREGAISYMLAALKVFTFDSASPMILFLHVAAKPGIRVGELEEATKLPRSTVSRLVTALSTVPQEKKGYGLLAYGDNPGDRRSKTLHLTKKGERLIEQLVVIHKEQCRQ